MREGMMKDNMRASLAYIAGCIVNKKNYSVVIDQKGNKSIRMTGIIAKGNIDAQNIDEGSKLVGMISGNEISFFHSLENISVRLTLKGSDFKGLDGGSGKDFSGSVNGKAVKVYDGGEFNNYFYELVD